MLSPSPVGLHEYHWTSNEIWTINNRLSHLVSSLPTAWLLVPFSVTPASSLFVAFILPGKPRFSALQGEWELTSAQSKGNGKIEHNEHRLKCIYEWKLPSYEADNKTPLITGANQWIVSWKWDTWKWAYVFHLKSKLRNEIWFFPHKSSWLVEFGWQ